MGHLVTLLSGNKRIVSDSFNRSDNATSIGKADTGQSWVNSSGTWGIVGGVVRVTTPSGGNDRAVVDSGTNISRRISTTIFGTGGQQARLIFRFQDINNEIIFGEFGTGVYVISKRVSGANTTLSDTGIAAQSGDRLAVELNGSEIKAYVNGVLRGTVTETFLQNTTMAGFLTTTGTQTKSFDDFRIEPM